MNPSHKALRDNTREAHERVDGAFAAFDLTQRNEYAAFLRAHAEVLLPLEAALDAAGAEQVTPDWPMRKRGGLIGEDLAFLRDAGRHAPPAAPEAWRLDTLEAAAGALYVLEGSRLGGKFLARQLPLSFPRAYLAPDQPAEKWRNLLDRIDAILYEPARLQSALAAAHLAFAAFERSAVRWVQVKD
ncbi:biliverdin-producing heme oxygenase [Sphingomonas xinjiangensis]|uniref:Heme oxygenase n=1 Tax=Sphingomonas xinjiangensis TaxID=643568 RepID=A0A840YPJ0_9SPHN|nr:biliverdin-producing heme oxygenase [Sphingomonas xinjiangensis]MBB5710161.1 heme oxygenase [Sphingomonas xinjiangensis]